MTSGNLNKSQTTRLSIRLIRSDHACLVCLVMGIFGVSLLTSIPREDGKTADIKPVRFRLDLNSASREELMLLPGIGEVRADSIVRYRQETGPFQSVEELRQIKGIGPKTLAGLIEFVHVPQISQPVFDTVIARSPLTHGHLQNITTVSENMD